jgi:glycosyltransferase involved in cell wall biosynthesis
MTSETDSPAPSISLIIPAYNEEEYIGDCLQAILEHGGGRFCEILVIDNASTDHTGEMAAQYPGVRVVREDTKGLPYARQRGYLEAKGDVLAYVDADTRMPNGWAELIEYHFSHNSKLACVSGPYQYYDIPTRHQRMVTLWYWVAKPVYLAFGYMATGGNFAIRKTVLDAMGGFDTNIAFYGEDTAIAREASRYGKVYFTHRLTMPTSGRRFKEHGYVRVGYDYLSNFLSVALSGSAAKQTYEDIR